jgi:hypothetical protein
VIVAASNRGGTTRYLLPLYSVLPVVVAAFLARLRRASVPVFALALAAVLVVQLRGTVATADVFDPGRLERYGITGPRTARCSACSTPTGPNASTRSTSTPTGSPSTPASGSSSPSRAQLLPALHRAGGRGRYGCLVRGFGAPEQQLARRGTASARSARRRLRRARPAGRPVLGRSIGAPGAGGSPEAPYAVDRNPGTPGTRPAPPGRRAARAGPGRGAAGRRVAPSSPDARRTSGPSCRPTALGDGPRGPSTRFYWVNGRLTAGRAGRPCSASAPPARG